MDRVSAWDTAGWKGFETEGWRPWPGLRERAIAALADQEVAAAWRAHAGEVTSGGCSLLGTAWPRKPGTPDWHLDPVTGRHWPSAAFAFAIDYRHGTACGDVKLVWELNRLQHLPPLAALAAASGERALAQCCLEQLDSWLAANPPLRGINWCSGIEVALRALSITLVLSLLDPASIAAERQQRYLAGLAAHGRWLRRYPARFSSANNHLVAEAAALYVLGSLLPETGAVGDWRARGRAVLVDEVERQFLADGVGAEHSPTYAAFSLELFTLAGALAAQLGEPLAEGYWQRLEAAAGHLGALLDRRGHHPRIGDDDEGRAIAAPGPEPHYVGSVLAMLSALRERPDLAPPLPAKALRNVLFGAAAANRQQARGVQHYPHGGYTVARFDAGGEEALVVVDHGPLGFLSIAAHGHADALALWLHLDGEPVLIDAGTHRYYGAGSWRDTLRGTAAHNTLCVGGTDASRIAGAFNWSHKAKVELIDWSSGDGSWALTARHDGYRRQFGCDHERSVRQCSSERIEIVDRLIGQGAAWPVEIGFLLAPGLEVSGEGGTWRVCRGSRAVLAIAAAGPLTGAVQHGLEHPRAGWCSPRYGTLVPTRRLVFAGRLAPREAARFTLLLGGAAGAATGPQAAPENRR